MEGKAHVGFLPEEVDQVREARARGDGRRRESRAPRTARRRLRPENAPSYVREIAGAVPSAARKTSRAGHRADRHGPEASGAKTASDAVACRVGGEAPRALLVDDRGRDAGAAGAELLDRDRVGVGAARPEDPQSAKGPSVPLQMLEDAGGARRGGNDRRPRLPRSAARGPFPPRPRGRPANGRRQNSPPRGVRRISTVTFEETIAVAPRASNASAVGDRPRRGRPRESQEDDVGAPSAARGSWAPPERRTRILFIVSEEVRAPPPRAASTSRVAPRARSCSARALPTAEDRRQSETVADGGSKGSLSSSSRHSRPSSERTRPLSTRAVRLRRAASAPTGARQPPRR